MAKMVLKSTEEINQGRKRIRLIFTIAIIPFILVASVMALKVANMYIETQKAIDNFNTAQEPTTSAEDKTKILEKTVELVDGLDKEIFAERWIVSYNYGTVLLGENKNNPGIEKLKQSLSEIESDKPEICLIYANLAIGYEQLGDEYATKKDNEQASYWYGQALLVTQTASPSCSPPPNPNQSNDSSEEQTPDQQGGESLQETKERVQGKQEALNGEPNQNGNNGNSTGETPNDSSPDQSDLDKVREQMDKSAQDKAEQDAGNSGDSGQPEPNTWEKPW